MPKHHQRAYVHLVPIEPGESLPSWLLRIAARNAPNFNRFSAEWFSDELRMTPGFDAFPAASLLLRLGAIRSGELDHYITHHTFLGTTKPFYTELEWQHLINTHGVGGSRIYALRRKAKQRSWHICPVCRRLELERGIATWQVFPQIPGVLCCSRHHESLALCTNTRIPPLTPPVECDLFREQGLSAISPTGLEGDRLSLAQDIAEAHAAGLCCRSPHRSLRDSLGNLLFGARWSDQIKIWPVLVDRFGEAFLDAAQVRTYHQQQIRWARLHPSFHGIVYLALLARAFDSKLPDLLASAKRASPRSMGSSGVRKVMME